MGWGVEQGETFEAVVEARVSRRLAELAAGGFELMNLSVPGYRPPQQVMALEEALKFSPHIVFYTAAGREQWNTISFLADILAAGVEIHYPELKQIVAAAGVSPGRSRPESLKRPEPYDRREEQCGGKRWVGKCRCGGWPVNEKKKKNKK